MGLPRDGKPPYATPEQLIQRYDAIGVERAVLLPGVSPEANRQIQSVEEVLEISEADGRFIPFCNVDPRQVANSPDAPLGELLEFYRSAGCKGVGEVTANLPFDHPMVENLFRHCERLGMPVTFHVSPTLGGTYGLYDEPALPRLEEALQKFPELVFLGHSQPFWAEIGPLEDVEQRGGYPSGPVQRPGRVVELMRRHPNLHGDLSANSGYNAVSRDEGFGAQFLAEFEDRLYFGTDICAPDTPTPLVDYLLRLREEGRISPPCFDKIAKANAARLLEL
jgi:predicted TIM-barrel fold metal-dependent hydrolase